MMSRETGGDNGVNQRQPTSGIIDPVTGEFIAYSPFTLDIRGSESPAIIGGDNPSIVGSDGQPLTQDSLLIRVPQLPSPVNATPLPGGYTIGEDQPSGFTFASIGDRLA
jgi:hypothetical protein